MDNNIFKETSNHAHARPPRRGALKVRPRLIASVPGLDDPLLSPFERFEKLTRMIVSVPKEEADKVTHERKGGRESKPPTKRQESNYNASHDKA
jgi:hypothetical protein